MLEEVLNDILQELLVDQAASYLTEESPELNELEVGLPFVNISGPCMWNA